MESLHQTVSVEVPRLDVLDTEVLLFRISPCTDRQSTDRDKRVLLKKSVIGNNTAKHKKRKVYYFLGRLTTSCMLSIDEGVGSGKSAAARLFFISVCALCLCLDNR